MSAAGASGGLFIVWQEGACVEFCGETERIRLFNNAVIRSWTHKWELQGVKSVRRTKPDASEGA